MRSYNLQQVVSVDRTDSGVAFPKATSCNSIWVSLLTLLFSIPGMIKPPSADKDSMTGLTKWPILAMCFAISFSHTRDYYCHNRRIAHSSYLTAIQTIASKMDETIC